MNHRWLTPGEYAEIYRVSPKTIIRMCERGEIGDAVKFGRQWRIPNPYWEEERGEGK